MRNHPEGPTVQSDCGTLFSSQLDPKETKSHVSTGPCQEENGPGVVEIRSLGPRPVDLRGEGSGLLLQDHFRHHAWMGDRERVYAALDAANQSSGRLGRFAGCGQGGMVFVSADGQRAKVMSINCHDRLCEPCAIERAWHVRGKLASLMGERFHRLITLTMAGNNAPLKDCMVGLNESFIKLRRTEFWKRTVSGGAWFQEITRGREGRHWHAHAHAITCGTWVDWHRLKAEWAMASGGSYVVDVRAVDDNKGQARYVSDYCSKGVSRSLYYNHDLLVEAVIALKGSRLIGTFGDWWNVNLEEEEQDQVEWKEVEKVSTVVRAAVDGAPWAVGLLLLLKRQVRVRNGQLRYSRITTGPDGPIERSFPESGSRIAGDKLEVK